MNGMGMGTLKPCKDIIYICTYLAIGIFGRVVCLGIKNANGQEKVFNHAKPWNFTLVSRRGA